MLFAFSSAVVLRFSLGFGRLLFFNFSEVVGLLKLTSFSNNVHTANFTTSRIVDKFASYPR